MARNFSSMHSRIVLVGGIISMLNRRYIDNRKKTTNERSLFTKIAFRTTSTVVLLIAWVKAVNIMLNFNMVSLGIKYPCKSRRGPRALHPHMTYILHNLAIFGALPDTGLLSRVVQDSVTPMRKDAVIRGAITAICQVSRNRGVNKMQAIIKVPALLIAACTTMPRAINR